MPTAAMQPKARHLVLSEIKKTGGLTVRQLASNLGVTTVAVRKQLAILEQEGLVRGRQVKIPRGRPASTYELTARARDLFPQTYNQVLIDILEDLRDLDGDEKVKLLLDQRNKRLLERYGRRIADKPLVEKVRELANARDEDGYMATFEVEGDQLVLTEHNCPIYEMAARLPQTCSCEHDLFRELLQTEVTREVTMTDGASCCRYTISGDYA